MKGWQKCVYAVGAMLGLSFCEARNEVVYGNPIKERQKQACGDALAALKATDFDDPQRGGPLCDVKACLRDASLDKKPVAVVLHSTRLDGPVVQVGFDPADPTLCKAAELSVTRYSQW